MLNKALKLLYKRPLFLRFERRTDWVLTLIWPHYRLYASLPGTSYQIHGGKLAGSQAHYVWSWKNWLFTDNFGFLAHDPEFICTYQTDKLAIRGPICESIGASVPSFESVLTLNPIDESDSPVGEKQGISVEIQLTPGWLVVHCLTTVAMFFVCWLVILSISAESMQIAFLPLILVVVIYVYRQIYYGILVNETLLFIESKILKRD